MHEYFIRRKVTTIVMFLSIILFGIIGLNKLKMDLLPDISFPTLTIITIYNNVAPSEIETLVTKPIEEMVSSVSGVDHISSESIEGVSLITVRFRWGTDMDQASIQTREKVDLVKGSLPQDVRKSIVIRFDPNNAPLMQLAVENTGVDMKDMRFFLKKSILPYFERIDGVAAISISGGFERQILIHVDKGKLFSYNITLQEIISQLDASNFNFPAGNIKNGDKEVLVRTSGAFRNISMIEQTVVGSTKAGLPIYLKNIARIEDGFKERTSISEYNNQECVALVIKKEAGKNTVAVADATDEVINELNEKFHDKIKIHKVSDQSIFIRDSIMSVATSALLAIVICYCVLIFFLGSFREPIIVISAVPISILVTFLFMFFKGITLNTMSLGGLATGVGMVVDSATIVLESIYLAQKKYPNKTEAAIIGTKEVFSSVVASTITSCVVFIPILFVEGMAGAIFGEFALTITFSLLSSLLVSVTLVPVMTLFPFFQSKPQSIPLKNNNGLRERIIEKITGLFVNLVLYANTNRKKFILFCFTLIPLTVFVFMFIPAELMPEIDQGEFTLKIVAEEGATLNTTSSISKKITKIIERQRISDQLFTRVGFEERDISINPQGDFGLNRGEVFVKVKHNLSSEEAIEKVRSEIESVGTENHAKISFIPAKSIISNIFSGGGSGITIEVSGQNIAGIKDICTEIELELYKIKELTDIYTSFREESPEYRIELDRDKMALFGLNVEMVATTLKAALKGEISTKYRENDYEFDVLVRLQELDRTGVNSLNDLTIRLPSGKSIQLNSFAQIIPAKMSRKIIRGEGKRLGMIFANYSDLKQSQVEKTIAPIIAKYDTKKEYAVVEGELNKETNKSFKALGYAGILATLLIYMAMASQFENLILPLIVMGSIFLDGLGIGLGLLISKNTLNIISIMGIVMLGGLVVNNAIILIEFYQQQKDEFHSQEDLIVAGVKRRINTILNTTATTVLGLIPAAFEIGGPSPQAPMAVTVIGGLLFSSVLTVVLIPIAYLSIVNPQMQKHIQLPESQLDEIPTSRNHNRKRSANKQNTK